MGVVAAIDFCSNAANPAITHYNGNALYREAKRYSRGFGVSATAASTQYNTAEWALSALARLLHAPHAHAGTDAR
jgi:hypothetical protein